ncbi:methyltransferase domain-containing protein [Synechococcus sp. ATX 2A4]|nr:methyltransferase domain-containing protein [Synechococcus sp. ATX 2A4]
MKPAQIDFAYHKIGSWRHAELLNSTRGLAYLAQAICLCSEKHKALDVGCESGGHFRTALAEAGFEVSGLDVSQEMRRIAKEHHSEAGFIRADVSAWEPPGHYGIITTWDRPHPCAPRAAEQRATETVPFPDSPLPDLDHGLRRRRGGDEQHAG